MFKDPRFGIRDAGFGESVNLAETGRTRSPGRACGKTRFGRHSVCSAVAEARIPNLESRRQQGFTLIEMMAVLVLIGIVMSIVGSKVFQNFQSGEYKAGVAQVHSLEMKVQAYILDNGSAPQSLNDLITRPGTASNWNGPYAKESDLKDPFGHAFQYKAPGEHGDFDIVFLGKDGAPGGDGLNKDRGNWE